MSVKTNILPVKTKCSNQLIYPLHIAPTVHQVRDAQRWVRASNVFILNPLLLRNFAKFWQTPGCPCPPIDNEQIALPQYILTIL